MSSDGADHLSSVQNNPFVRRYGLPHHTSPQDCGSVISTVNCSDISERQEDDDQEQEYHVNSGFVNKLRSKFAQLGSKSNQVLLSRKSASVENLLNIGSHCSLENFRNKTRHGSTDIINNDDYNVSFGYKPQIKSRKQNLNHNIDKPAVSKSQVEKHKNHILRDGKPPLSKKPSTELLAPVRRAHSSSSENVTAKVKSVHHDWKVAPDVEVIGRDNIIIIESSNSSKCLDALEEQKNKKDSAQDVIDAFKVAKPLTHIEKLGDGNELPKSNIVSAYRTIFESTTKTSDTINISRNQHSATRKSSVSDIISPRSSLVRVNDDNVFEKSLNINMDMKFSKVTSSRNSSSSDAVTSKVESPRNSVNLYTGALEVTRNTSSIIDTAAPCRNSISVDTNNGSLTKNSFSTQDCSPNIDTTSTSLQRSLELFQKSSEDKGQNVETKCRSYDERKQRATQSISTVQQKLIPARPISNVFDSKSIKSAEKVDRSKQLEPQVVVNTMVPKDNIEVKHDADERRSLELEKSNIQKIPKDTIELKHEAQRRRSLELEQGSHQNSEFVSRNISTDISDEAFVDTKNDIAAEVTVTVVTTGKLSPRKTEIFNSSDMVKKKRKPPNVSIIPLEHVSSVPVTNNLPQEIMVENLEIEQDEPFQKQTEQDSIGMADLSVISNTDSFSDTKINVHKFKGYNFSNSSLPLLPSHEEKESKIPPTTNLVNDMEVPVSGMSSFLTSMKKSQSDLENQLKTFEHLANGSSPSPISGKWQAPERPLANTCRSLDVEMTEDKSIPPPQSTLEPVPSCPDVGDVIRRPKKSPQQTTKMVFDSSKIATKRKAPPKRKPHRKTVNELNQDIQLDNSISVPKLDLSSITNDKAENEYQDGYIPTMIKPCPYVFIGAGVIFERTPYKKSKKVKVKISFADHATTTFEYEGEELALENYLVEHPEERDEVLKQEQEIESSELGQKTEDVLHDSPRALPDSESHMKSNTVLGLNAGALTSYKSKMQIQEFQFGVHTELDIKFSEAEIDLDQAEPESFHFLPAEDHEADAFSSEVDKSDMLF